MSMFRRILKQYSRSVTNIFSDYSETIKNVNKYWIERPYQFSFASSCVLILSILTFKCPDQESYFCSITECTNDISLLPPGLRSKKSEKEIYRLKSSLDESMIRSISLGPCRVAYMDKKPLKTQLFSLTSNFLMPSSFTFYDRILDVGFWNKWWYITSVMVDFDVCDDEK